jgi:hypothetical protein
MVWWKGRVPVEEGQDELKHAVVRKMVEFWASAFDAMLQDFREAFTKSDASNLDKAVATAKVAQLSILAFQWFNTGLTGIGPTDEEKASCTRAIKAVKDMCQKHIDEVDRSLEPEPLTVRNIRLLN